MGKTLSPLQKKMKIRLNNRRIGEIYRSKRKPESQGYREAKEYAMRLFESGVSGGYAL